MDEKKVREAIERIHKMRDAYNATLRSLPQKTRERSDYNNYVDAFLVAIKALEKQISKKPICVPKLYSEELGFNDEIHCPSCRRYVGFFMEGMSEPEQMEYCCDCGQRIAKDWSE